MSACIASLNLGRVTRSPDLDTNAITLYNYSMTTLVGAPWPWVAVSALVTSLRMSSTSAKPQDIKYALKGGKLGDSPDSTIDRMASFDPAQRNGNAPKTAREEEYAESLRQWKPKEAVNGELLSFPWVR
jgi:hypothetical protein